MGQCVCKERANTGDGADTIERIYSSTEQYRAPPSPDRHRGSPCIVIQAAVPWEDRTSSARKYIASKFQSDRKRHPSGAKILEKSRMRVQQRLHQSHRSLLVRTFGGSEKGSTATSTATSLRHRPSLSWLNVAVAAERRSFEDKEMRMMEKKVLDLASSLPQRIKDTNGDADRFRYTVDELFEDDRQTPKAPLMLARLYERAFQDMDGNWASQKIAQALMDENIHYVSPEGLDFHGMRSVCAKLNEAMDSIISRINQFGGAVQTTKVDMQSTGPTQTPSGTWKMQYKASMSLMMKISIDDEFTISDDGLILKLVRTRG